MGKGGGGCFAEVDSAFSAFRGYGYQDLMDLDAVVCLGSLEMNVFCGDMAGGCE